MIIKSINMCEKTKFSKFEQFLFKSLLDMTPNRINLIKIVKKKNKKTNRGV
jgi:hypothetical protein